MADPTGEIVEEGACFAIIRDDGALWVRENLHTERGDVPKRWRIRCSSVESAKRLIVDRLREGHDKMYHFSQPPISPIAATRPTDPPGTAIGYPWT